jgi:putative ABC transport system ATP-binding protein
MQHTQLHPEAHPADPVHTVTARDLTRRLPVGEDTVDILKGVSFDIRRGEWIALMGPSGSGKSTLLGILAGLDTPNSGQILLDGIDITRMRERELARIRNRKIGIVFQSFNLIAGLTAQENVEVPLYAGADGQNISERAGAMLELVGLGDRRHHRPNQLSGGQQQRVAIARALVTRPALLIADEPTGNLDSTTSAQMLDLFARLHTELGVTLFVATHDRSIAACADRVLHLVDGQLAAPVEPVRRMPNAVPEQVAALDGGGA